MKKKKIPISLGFSLSQLKHHDTIEWNHKGLIGIISKEKIQNAIQYLEDKIKILPHLKDPMYVFYWNDVEVVKQKPKSVHLNQD